MDVPIHERRDRFEALVRKQYGMLLAYIRAIAGQSERAVKRAIRSITFTLQPGAPKPDLEWYEHQTHAE